MNSKTRRATELTRQKSAEGYRAERIEVERKFLVANLPELTDLTGEETLQGYISTASDCAEVRIRQKGNQFFQTIKSEGGLTRSEIEVEISNAQFDLLWTATEGRRLKKTRYDIPCEGLTIELDVYGGDLAGLLVAEVEFLSEDESARFNPPSWFGQEVTNDRAFRNKQLAEKGMPAKAIKMI
jgi:adenylate cyclase